MNPDNNERELLKGLAKSDKKAVETIYKEHFNMVQSLIINNNGTSDDARDTFQEAMIVLFEKARSGTFELNCQLKTYVYSVCRRIWLKRLQQLNRYVNEIEGFETVSVDEDIEEHEKSHEEFLLMEKTINNLGEPCKGLIEAYYIQKKNMQEIANQFGYTNADNAKNQKYKCLMRLKKLFFAQYKNGK